MIRDITIGQYYPANSVIHRLDPRVKIVATLLFLISLFVQKSVLGYLVATLFLAGVIHLSKVPLKFIMKGLKPIMILLLITVAFNLFLNNGAGSFLDFSNYRRWTGNLGIYGDPSHLSDRGIVDHDIYNHSECTDRWDREAAPTAEQSESSGT